jgi:hypothetical protein
MESPFCNIGIAFSSLNSASQQILFSSVFALPNAFWRSDLFVVSFMFFAGRDPGFLICRLNAMDLFPAAAVFTVAVTIGRNCFRQK